MSCQPLSGLPLLFSFLCFYSSAPNAGKTYDVDGCVSGGRCVDQGRVSLARRQSFLSTQTPRKGPPFPQRVAFLSVETIGFSLHMQSKEARETRGRKARRKSVGTGAED